MNDQNEFHDDDFEIKEERGWLPQWWLFLFYGSIVFALVFAGYLHGIAGWSQEKQYDEEVAAHNKKHPPMVASLTGDGINPLRNDPQAIAAGQKHYLSFCAACHKPDLSGLIGPNLLDREWLHTNSDAGLFKLVMEGVSAEAVRQKPSKGIMPPHKDSLGPRKVLEVLAYLASKNPSLREK